MTARAARVAAVLLILVGAVVARVLVSSRALLARAEAAGDPAERRLLLGEAARMDAPGNPFSARARHLLAVEGRTGSGEAALAAWRELRASILGARSVYTPARALLEEADRELARRAADPAHAAAVLAAADADAPSPGWSLVALVGLFGWITAAAALFLVGIGPPPEARWRRRPALALGAAVALGLVLFWLGLWRA